MSCDQEEGEGRETTGAGEGPYKTVRKGVGRGREEEGSDERGMGELNWCFSS